MEHLRNYPECNGKKYYVSTANTSDHGLETMVFNCDEDGEVHDWNELHVERYDNEHDAKRGHMRICHDIEKYVGDQKPEEAEEKNVHEDDEKTVTITSRDLMEALSKAWAKYIDMADDDGEKVERTIESITKGALIAMITARTLFGKDDE